MSQQTDVAQETFWAESYRSYLHLLGLAQLEKPLIDKVDLSGIVQTTMLEVFQQPPAVEPCNSDQQRAWLRRLFLNNLLDAVRKLRTQKRNLRAEVPLEASIDNSASRLQLCLASDDSSPSVQAIRTEQADRLLQSVARLPAAQRQAIELHHLHSLPLEEIALRMQRPKGAVAALIYRGMQTLRACEVLQD